MRPVISSLVALGIALGFAPGASGQVYKCVDANGRVTYQQAPCPANQKGGRVALYSDNGSTREPPELEEQWARETQMGGLSEGMPKRYVQQTFGSPTEVRQAAPGENASEVWTFKTARGPLRVGFLGEKLAWWRNEQPGQEASQADIANTDSPRARLAEGRDCREALNELGQPNEEQPMRLSASLAGGDDKLVDAVRYSYEPDATLPNVRLSFACVNGRVADVSRTLIH